MAGTVEGQMDGIIPSNTARKESRRTIRLVAIFLIALIIAMWGGYTQGWTWTGIGPYFLPTASQDPVYVPAKTLWDWLELLIIPIVLAGAAILFNRSERIAEREIATNRRQDMALQAYLDSMTSLQLDNGLRTSEPDSEVRAIARARTLTVLRGLDGFRKGMVLQYLYDSDLLINEGINQTIVSLSGADFRGAELRKANLSRASLGGFDLRDADLEMANLSGAIMPRQDLRGANLRGTSFGKAYMLGADLEGADLGTADLEGPDRKWYDRMKIGMAEDNLDATDLIEANLYGAMLADANLKNAKVSDKQLKNAESLKGATMPNGEVNESGEVPD